MERATMIATQTVIVMADMAVIETTVGYDATKAKAPTIATTEGPTETHLPVETGVILIPIDVMNSMADGLVTVATAVAVTIVAIAVAVVIFWMTRTDSLLGPTTTVTLRVKTLIGSLHGKTLIGSLREAKPGEVLPASMIRETLSTIRLISIHTGRIWKIPVPVLAGPMPRPNHLTMSKKVRLIERSKKPRFRKTATTTWYRLPAKTARSPVPRDC